MPENCPDHRPAAVALNTTGQVISVDREKVSFLAVEKIGEGPEAQTVTRLITITNLGDPRSRALAHRIFEPMPVSIRFG